MIALWDTSGADVVRALSAERRTAGGVTSGLALTLIACVDEKRVREAETAAATAAAAHPCRLIIVVRGDANRQRSRLDAEIVVGGRLGPAEAVVLRMFGELVNHAESVAIPLLAPDVPVVTWWHESPPRFIAADPLGVVAERRITDSAQAPDPIDALWERAHDYAPGDTDLAWTRTTQWRTLLAGALDTETTRVRAINVTAPAQDPTAALLRGWLQARLGVTPSVTQSHDAVAEVRLTLATGEEISVRRDAGAARLSRTGMSARIVPMTGRSLGEELAEELRRLDPDQPYAAALEATAGVSGLDARDPNRVHSVPATALSGGSSTWFNGQ